MRLIAADLRRVARLTREGKPELADVFAVAALRTRERESARQVAQRGEKE